MDYFHYLNRQEDKLAWSYWFPKRENEVRGHLQCSPKAMGDHEGYEGGSYAFRRLLFCCTVILAS